MTGPLLDVEGIDVVYHTRQGLLAALRDVGFTVAPGEILGIVGESGCGKSTLSSTLLRLLPPNGEVTGGQIRLRGRDLLRESDEQMRARRGRELAMIFQDPLTSLNPAFTVGTQLVDVQAAHSRKSRERRTMRQRSIEMLEQVGIPDARERIDDYPHQFSGGMSQRVMISMARLLEPALLIADEPTSSLDVTLEAQILELLRQLLRDHDTAILFISHDLGVIAQLCDRVVVMYAGQTVEEGDVESIYASPLHPYTQALLAAVPSRTHRAEWLATIPGRVPSLAALPAGCTFAARCPYAQDVCRRDEPRYLNVEGRRVRCAMRDPMSGFDLRAPPSRLVDSETAA